MSLPKDGCWLFLKSSKSDLVLTCVVPVLIRRMKDSFNNTSPACFKMLRPKDCLLFAAAANVDILSNTLVVPPWLDFFKQDSDVGFPNICSSMSFSKVGCGFF